MNDIIIKEKDNIKYLQFKLLLELGINHGFYIGRELDFRTINDNGLINKNIKSYELFLNILDMNYKRVIKCLQDHTDNIKIVDKSYIKEKELLNIIKDDNNDALITNDSSIILGIMVADCNLIYAYDKNNNVIACIHSGWKGTLKSITIKTINKMISVFNSNPKDIIICFNPSIRKCHFEVDNDVYSLFKEKFNDNKYYEYKNNKWYIDLVLIIKDELLNIGVLESNIIDSNICSYCNKNIHSYRRDKDNYKLTAGFIKLKEE